jgi:hypothetical protein
LTTTFKALAKHGEGPINSLTDVLASWERKIRVNVGANSGTPYVQRNCQQRHDVDADAKGSASCVMHSITLCLYRKDLSSPGLHGQLDGKIIPKIVQIR